MAQDDGIFGGLICGGKTLEAKIYLGRTSVGLMGQTTTIAPIAVPSR